MSTKRRPGGFTLIEVLLALAILATVLVLLLASFTGASRGLEVLSERSGSFRRIRITMDRLGSDLEGTVSSTGSEPTAFLCREDRFSGNPASTLIFTAYVLPDVTGTRPPADLVKIKYYPKVSDDGRHIDLYREQADLPLIENRIPTTESRLAAGLLGFRVELFNGTAWTKEWPAAGGSKWRLPKKVAFVMTDHLGQEFRREIPLPLAGMEAAGTYSGKRGTEGGTTSGQGTPGQGGGPVAVPPPPPRTR